MSESDEIGKMAEKMLPTHRFLACKQRHNNDDDDNSEPNQWHHHCAAPGSLLHDEAIDSGKIAPVRCALLVSDP